MKINIGKMDLQRYEWLLDEAIKLAIQIGIALVILVIGFWITSKIKNVIRNRMIKRNLDASIREFTLPIISILLKLMVVLSAINAVGIQITSFAAILAGLAAGIGLSLQGSLSNFAGGLLIIVFKPFKVGDYIVSMNNGGTVESISILYTTLVTPENLVIILPNSTLLNNPVTNYSVKDTRRLDIKVGISYGDDVEKTQQILKEMLENEPLILKDQEIVVEVLNFGASSVDLAVRAFVKRTDYWDAYYKLHKKTKETLDDHGVSIPFPQTEMRIINPSKPEDKNSI